MTAPATELNPVDIISWFYKDKNSPEFPQYEVEIKSCFPDDSICLQNKLIELQHKWEEEIDPNRKDELQIQILDNQKQILKLKEQEERQYQKLLALNDAEDLEKEQTELSREEISNHALSILITGHALEKMIETFNLDHVGDDRIAIDLAYTCVSSVIANGEGLHTFLSGKSGVGKTHSVEVFMKQIPDIWKIVGTFSDKYLFYASKSQKDTEPHLKPGMVVVIDDHTFNEGVQEIFKTSISHWKDGVEYGTVVNQDSKRLQIPNRIAWILMKVDDPGDDQVMNRLNQLRIKESDGQRRNIEASIKGKYTNVIEQNVIKEKPDVLICREMWQWLKKQQIAVQVTWANEVQLANTNYRNIERFFQFVMAHAALNMAQRSYIGNTIDKIPIIEAIQEDFIAAKEHYTSLFSDGAQSHNLIQSESDVIECLLKLNPNEGVFTIQDVAKESQRSGKPMEEQTIRRALGGRGTSKNSEKLGGLIGKCPYIRSGGSNTTFETEADITNYDEHSHCIEIRKKKSHNQRIYSVDIEALKTWYEQGEQVSINPEYKWKEPTTIPLYQALPQLFQPIGKVQNAQIEEFTGKG